MRYLIIFFSLIFVNCNKSVDVKTISVEELKTLLATQKIQLLDVRTPEEVAQGSINSAKFINYFDKDFYKKASAQLDKKKPVYIFCRSSNRSSAAAAVLSEKGYKMILLEGGFTEWKLKNNLK